METRSIRSLTVSVLGLGCNNFGSRCDIEQSRAVVEAALDGGITVFDTAPAYGAGRSEEILGECVGPVRDDVVLVTKFGMRYGDDPDTGGASAERVRRAAEASLKRLGTDRIDLFLLHVPDPHTPVAETLGALDELVVSGLVRETGCCSVDAPYVRAARAASLDTGVSSFAAVQHHFNLLQRAVESELLSTCVDAGVGFMPYFPLESGFLTGKYRPDSPWPSESRFATARPITQERIDGIARHDLYERVLRLEALALRYDANLLDLALGWLARRPAVACIPVGATSPDQVEANVRAAAWTLPSDADAAIDAIVEPGVNHVG